MMKTELNVLLDTIQEAGEGILAVQKKGITATYKENQSPLTEADLLANEILRKNLLGHFPNDGWLSEETIDDPARLSAKRVWIIDPIDGTKEFVRGIPEYAISVALVEMGIPVLSAIYNPATRELFHAVKNQGAWFNQQAMHCKEHADQQLSILASRTELSEGKWDDFKRQHHIIEKGSIAYKLALIARGDADATFSLTPKSEWDIAAGILLVQEAQGKVSDFYGKDILLNQKNIRVNGIIAAHQHLYPTIFSVTQQAQLIG